MNIKLIIKGMLLYITFLLCILAAMGIDSLCDKGYIIETLCVIIGLVYLCEKNITEEEFNTLTFSK